MNGSLSSSLDLVRLVRTASTWFATPVAQRSLRVRGVPVPRLVRLPPLLFANVDGTVDSYSGPHRTAHDRPVRRREAFLAPFFFLFSLRLLTRIFDSEQS